MLHRYISRFLEYCRLVDFSIRSIQALTARLIEFAIFLKLIGIDKKLHARLFRHTAAKHLNKVAGTDITQHVLGHSHRANTLKYAHLNPDKYAIYMNKHPFMRKEAS